MVEIKKNNFINMRMCKNVLKSNRKTDVNMI